MGTVDAAGLLSEMAGRVENLTGCILARDGLILEAVPESQQTAIRGAWMRFSAIGGFEKGYLQFDGELWICVQRAPYELFVLARLGAKPGLILDLAGDCLEQVEVLAASTEEPDQVVVLPSAEGEVLPQASPADDAPAAVEPAAAAPAAVEPAAAAPAAVEPAAAAPAAVEPAAAAAAPEEGEEKTAGQGTPAPRPVSWIVASGNERKRERPARSVSWIRVGNPESTEDEEDS